MKLFQKLLLAPTAIGFLTPINVSASEANLMDVSNYSHVDVQVTQDTFTPLSSKNPLLAGGEGLNSSSGGDFDGDTFSSTTSASFTSNWLLGAVGESSDETTKFVYDYGIELTTSFTGSDSLDVELEAGNNNLSDLDHTSSGNVLSVGSISYTTQLGDKLTLYTGHGGAAGSALYTPACVYSGQTDVLDDCGIAVSNLDEEFGTAFGASFDLGAGFTAALGYESQGDTANGFATKESSDAFGGQVAYTGDNYGVAIAFSSIENHDASTNAISSPRAVTTSTGISAYFSPDLENFPSISVGLETTHDDKAASTADESSNYFVGVQWDEIGQGTLGAAFGSKAPYAENDDAETMYEVFYSYNYADGITITPIMYVKENSAANTSDETGLVLKTTFSF